MTDTPETPDGTAHRDRARRPVSVVVSLDADGTWHGLPGRIRPEDWVTGQADPAVPGSVLAAEGERRPEGGFRYDPAG